ncbi:MAG: hypothetical protein LCH70_13850 [Proteobacteria bacterium]|nr:hypothetical protein [Pseudomonadota bacterium]
MSFMPRAYRWLLSGALLLASATVLADGGEAPQSSGETGCGVLEIWVMQGPEHNDEFQDQLLRCESIIPPADAEILKTVEKMSQEEPEASEDLFERKYRPFMLRQASEVDAPECSVMRLGFAFGLAPDAEGVDRVEKVLRRCEADFLPSDREALAQALDDARRRLTLPGTLEEAVEDVLGELDEKSKISLREMKRDDLIGLHFGFGMALRNELGLWGGNQPLLESICGGKSCHPDDASMKIIEALWERLQNQPAQPSN